jgi:hypothetical protein
MRYGGELVEATECEHSDFEYLKPLCPCCKEPVLLRKGGDRVSRLGKSFSVPAYWCHFPSKDPVLAALCEQRVSQFSEEEIQRRATQAKGQRLKLFQRWFWQIVSQLPMSQKEGETIGGIMEPHWDLYSSNRNYAEYSDNVTELVLQLLKQDLTDRIATVLQQFLDGDFEYFTRENNNGVVPPHLQNYLETFRAKVDMRLQRQIVAEAIGFLCSSRGIQFLRAFNFNAIIPFFTEPGLLPKLSEQLLLLCADNAIVITGLIPWAEEFEKLQKKL